MSPSSKPEIFSWLLDNTLSFSPSRNFLIKPLMAQQSRTLKVRFFRGQMVSYTSNLFLLVKSNVILSTRKIAWQYMQPLLENSHNPPGRLSTNHLRWILTPSEFLNHIITTLWTHVSKGWTHGTRATCVAWFPTNGTEAPSSLTNLSLGTWKLTSTKWSARNSPPSWGIHLCLVLNPIEARWSEWNSPPSWELHLPMPGLNPVQLKLSP